MTDSFQYLDLCRTASQGVQAGKDMRWQESEDGTGS
jgi:hypothetical protein